MSIGYWVLSIEISGLYFGAKDKQTVLGTNLTSNNPNGAVMSAKQYAFFAVEGLTPGPSPKERGGVIHCKTIG